MDFGRGGGHKYVSTNFIQDISSQRSVMVVLGQETLFLQLDFATSLGQFARIAATCRQAIATTTASDTVASTNVGTNTDLGERWVNICSCDDLCG